MFYFKKIDGNGLTHKNTDKNNKRRYKSRQKP